MSVSGRAEEEPASEEAPAPVRDMYEQKSVSKVVRVLTVLAYLFSVSFAAILLSIYYICVWKSPELPMRDMADTGVMSGLSARRVDNPYHFRYTGDSYIIHKLAGRSDTTVKESVTQPMPVVVSSLPTLTSVTELSSTASSVEDVATAYTTEAANDTSGGDVYNNFNVTDVA